MEINRLRHFCTVVETGHVRAAAELLHISPGALSKSLSVFRDEMKSDLFTLSGRRLLVTDFGRKIYIRAASILKELGEMSSLEASSTDSEKLFRVATFEVFSTHFLSRLIQNQERGQKFGCFELGPGNIEDAVDAGLADVGVTYLPVPKDTLDHLPVTKFSFGLYGNKKWKTAPIEELPFAVPTTHVPTLPSQLRGLDSWPSSVGRKVAFEFEMLETALLLSARGCAVLHCPEFIVRLFNEITSTGFQLSRLPQLEKISKPVLQTVYLVKRKDQTETTAMKKIAKGLRILLNPYSKQS